LFDRAAVAVYRSGLIATLMLLAPASGSAEWQIRPFAGLTFAGSTTFIDNERAAGSPNAVLGVSAMLLGDVIGADFDLGHAPGFFDTGDENLAHLVLNSRVTTITGNIVVALPRRLTEYTLRPYFVGGVGWMQVRTENGPPAEPLSISSTLGAVDFGGGVTGFLTERLGVGWEVRHFRTVGGDVTGVSLGKPEHLSFWRATMAAVVRY
jgi:hypothetical protein